MKLNHLLSLILYSIALGVLTVAHIYSMANAREVSIEEALALNENEILRINSTVQHLSFPLHSEMTEEIILATTSPDPNLRVAVLSPTAELLFSTAEFKADELERVLGASSASTTKDIHAVYTAERICIDSQDCIQVIAYYDATGLFSDKKRLIWQRSIMAFVFAILGTGLMMVVIQNRLTNRLAFLTNTLTQWAFGEREVSFDVGGNDEISVISSSIDNLVTRLEEEHSRLVTSQQLNEAIVSSSNFAIITTDRHGLIVSCNTAAEHLLGYDSKELVGHHTPLIFQDRSNATPQTSLVANFQLSYVNVPKQFTVEEDFSVEQNTTFVKKSGDRIRVMMSISPMFDSLDAHTGFVCIAKDIEGVLEAERKLRVNASVFSHSSQAIMIADSNQRIIDVNSRFLELLGATKQKIIGEDTAAFLSDRHSRAYFNRSWQKTLRSGEWSGEVWLKAVDGHEFPAEQVMHCINAPSGEVEHVIILSQDITAKKQAELKLEQMAFLDSLTNLPNRFLFRDRLEQAIESSNRADTSVALMFIDLDRFKQVNDNYGHEVGDQLLVQVAKRLQGIIRSEDTIARLGGDEFTIILNKLEPPRAYDIASRTAKRLIETIEKPIRVNGRDIFIGASVGIAMHPDNGRSFTELTRNADTAMYEAKANETDHFEFFDTAMHDQNRRRLLLETELRQDTERKHLHIRYQPIVDLENNRVRGFEALCRWTHPQLGEIPPSEFIGIAEDIGLINDLGHWVIENALEQLAVWHQRYDPSLYISINASGQQFKSDTFCSDLISAAKRFGVNHQHIEIEITETLLISHDPSTSKQIRDLRRNNFTLALDDFGTGYSSLSYLQKFPVSTLKVDRSFVRNAASDETDLTIIRAIVAIADRIDMGVIAEGVEEREQLQLLQREGVHLLQGFYFAEAMDAQDTLQYLQSSPLSITKSA